MMFHGKFNHLRDGVEMTAKIDISADLMQLAVFAEREDWLYQAERAGPVCLDSFYPKISGALRV